MPILFHRSGCAERLRRGALGPILAALALSIAPATAPAQSSTSPKAACSHCGVVESVTSVQRKGQAKGIAGTPVTPGTLAGGVIGGVLGNQIGHGSGRTAATVLGAAGGAYAGNTIEKNIKKYTAYQMRIRMNDGSVRTIEQRTAVPVGSHVVVEGSAVRLAGAARS